MRNGNRRCFPRVMEVAWHYYVQSYSCHRFVEHESAKTCSRLANLSVRPLCGYYVEGKSLGKEPQVGECRWVDAREVSASDFDLNL